MSSEKLNLDSDKLSCHKDRVDAWLAGERIPPITIDCALTRACNFKCVYCLRATSKILLDDFSWKEIKDVQVGDTVVGFNEKALGNHSRSKYFPTRVTKVFKRSARLHILASESSNDRLFITKDHPVLCQGHRWRSPRQFKKANIRFFCSPYNTDFKESYDYKLGYLKGLLEGDGTFGEYSYKGVNQYVFKLDLIDEEPLDKATAYINDLLCFAVSRRNRQIITTNSKENVRHLREAIKWKVASEMGFHFARGYLGGIFDAEGSLSGALRISLKTDLDTVGWNITHALEICGFKYVREQSSYRLLGGFPEIARFFGQAKPCIRRKVMKLFGKRIPSSRQVSHTSQGGTTELVYNLETESHTYVADGFCVHNCYSQLQENPGRPLPLDRIYRFLDDAAEIGVKAVSLVSDGESTCSPHWVKAILRGRKNNLDMALGTNGLKLSYNSLMDVLPNLTYLRFNISAAKPHVYARVHGVTEVACGKVLKNIYQAVQIKEKFKLPVTIGLQMVLLPELKDEIITLAKLGAVLGVDYLVIKHCSDDEFGTLGIDYAKYPDLFDKLREAEKLSTSTYQVAVKWSKIKTGRNRVYSSCYGPPFIMQFSGSGLVAPCGMLFHERYKKFHIGNLNKDSLKDLFRGERYWEVMDELASDRFDARTMCGSLCLQHKVNETLWDLKHGAKLPERSCGDMPHRNFV